MDISAVKSTINVYDINAVAQSNAANSSSSVSSSDATTSQLSGPARWMSELANLQKTDPDKFKQVTSEISDKLKQEASSATSQQATFLNNLADKFSQASQSGSMSSLQPPAGVQGHHGHHHHVQQYASQQQQQSANSAQQQFADVSQIIESTLQDAVIGT